MTLCLDFPANEDTNSTGFAVLAPLPLLAALDHYSRCEEDEQTFGVLLGSRANDKVTVTGTIPLKFLEEDGNTIDMELLGTLFSLQSKVNQEIIVGFYVVGALDELILEVSNQLKDKIDPYQPLVLFVDVSKFGTEFPITTLVPKSCKTANSTSKGTMFLEVPYEIVGLDSDASVCNLIIHLVKYMNDDDLGSDFEKVNNTLLKTSKLIESISDYVEGVVKIKSSPQIGKYLLDTIGEIPRLDPAIFRSLLSDHSNDLEMIRSLTSLTRKQLEISEKLRSIV